jgi:recombination protein RecA
MNEIKEITVGDVLLLMAAGKKIRVLTRNNEFVEITDYVDKGLLDTFKVTLENGFTIKVSREHKFFSNVGWVETKDIRPNVTKLFCEDGSYQTVFAVEYIGKHKIVDIRVQSEEHSYFGNGILNHNTGKSLISAHIVADTQKKGGIAVVIDTENAAAPEFWASLGVDLKNLLYIQSDTVEDVFEKMENIIAIVRKSSKKRILTIIVDSVAGVSTKAELESDHGKDGWSTGKAIIIGKAMRKITSMVGRQEVLIVFTNQLRQNLNAAMFGDKWIVSGGKALAFHCSVRVRLANAGMLKRGDMVIGNKCKAKVVKNRMGPPQRQASFDIYHDSGIADYGSWLEVMKTHDIVKYSAPNYTYHQDAGESVKFVAKDFPRLMSENLPLKAEIYGKICTAVIMKYKDPNSSILEDVTVDEDEDGVVSTSED